VPVEVLTKSLFDDLRFHLTTFESEAFEALVRRGQEVDGLPNQLDTGALAPDESRIR